MVAKAKAGETEREMQREEAQWYQIGVLCMPQFPSLMVNLNSPRSQSTNFANGRREDRLLEGHLESRLDPRSQNSIDFKTRNKFECSTL